MSVRLLVAVVVGIAIGVSPLAKAETASELMERATAAPNPGRLGSAIGADKKTGVGLYLGQPSGVSGKWWINPQLAIHGMVGAWLLPNRGGSLGVDVLFHVRDLAPDLEPMEVGIYVGGGMGVGWWTRVRYHQHTEPWVHWHSHEMTEALSYVRPIVGGAAWLREFPLELFVEVAPTVRLYPDGLGLGWGGALGGRYYF